MTAYLCEHAWLGGDASASDVLVETDGDRIVSVTPSWSGPTPQGTTRLAGLTLPGLANVHSHAFHRALRGRTHGGGPGSFWSWREQMYAVAARLDPETLYALARAVFGEMVLAGVTAVGEFHYLHHQAGGRPYGDPNATGHALVTAAREAGLRITLLDTCYLTGGIDRPLDGVQERFGDGTAARWADRVDALAAAYPHAADVVVGAAVHSVRAVPPDEATMVAAWAGRHGAPLHAHVSEQPAENRDAVEAYGRTPTAVLADAGVLGPRSTAVHATHLTDADVEQLGRSGTAVCLCPTTERELADGIGPAPELAAAGSPLCLGSDSQAVVDLFEEARAVELDERLRGQRRGTFSPAALLTAATSAGHTALGGDGGVLAPGRPADLVTVRLGSVRTAGTGTGPEVAVFAATGGDVVHVVASGRVVVRDGAHVLLGDVGRLLHDAVRALGPGAGAA
jgi:formiminoglutamate deiminase